MKLNEVNHMTECSPSELNRVVSSEIIFALKTNCVCMIAATYKLGKIFADGVSIPRIMCKPVLRI